jgi:hypothetical protein
MKKGKVHPDDKVETEMEDLATKRSFIEKSDGHSGSTQEDSEHKEGDSSEEVEEEKIDRDRVLRSALDQFINQSFIGRLLVNLIAGLSVLTSVMFISLTYFDSSAYDPCCLIPDVDITSTDFSI